MRRRDLSWLILPVLMAGALIAAPARPAHAATSLQAFVVQLADVRQIYGPGFRMVMSKAWSRDSIKGKSASVPGIQYSVAGYAGGYTTDFRRLASSIHQRLSAYYVDSSLAEFSDASAPRGNTQHMLAHLDRLAHAPQKTWVKVTASALHGPGDEALMETAQTKGKLPVYELIIFFRRGRYSETITVYGTSRPSTSSGVQLAGLVDARIKRGS